MRIYAMSAVAAGVLALGSTIVLVDCVTDARQDEPVQVISACDLGQLDTSAPTTPGSTIKTYVESATGLVTALNNASQQLQAVCTSIDQELGLPGGNDVVSACAPVGKRISAVSNTNPGGPPGVPGWFNFAAEPSCHVDPNAQAACVTTCSGPCDLTKCQEGFLEGKCGGQCTGTCSRAVQAGPCNGQCQGTCANSANNCTGECAGACDDFVLFGETCSDGCWQGFPGPDPVAGPFFGYCGGTCTGSCDGQPAGDGFPPPPDMDAGADPDAGDDAGDAGDAEPPPPPPPPPPLSAPPSNHPGNCPFPGFCVGICDKDASGQCFGAGCGGTFSNGSCSGTCTGSCTSALGTGCTVSSPADPDGGAPVTCTGTCTEPTGGADGGAGTCDGVCRGTCSVPLTDARCTGSLNCGQNAECALACKVKEATTVTCTAPASVEVEAVSDIALYNALKKFGPQLATALQTISILRTAQGAVEQRTLANFANLAPNGSLSAMERTCVAQGQSAANQAHTLFLSLAAADPTIVVASTKP